MKLVERVKIFCDTFKSNIYKFLLKLFVIFRLFFDKSEMHFCLQICRFCWHRIRTDENGLCPACRKAYSENPADFTPLSKEQVIKNVLITFDGRKRITIYCIYFNTLK